MMLAQIADKEKEMRAKTAMLALPLLALPLVALGGCHMKIGKDDDKANVSSVTVGEDGNVAIASADDSKGVSISVPGFQAKVDIPGLKIGDGNMDIDGMKLYPGTKLDAINVNGTDHGQKGVVMRFTSAAAPAALADYYADAAAANNFTAVQSSKTAAGATVTAIKPDGDHIKIAMAPAATGAGSQGSITVEEK
jgi:hypothetical protein